MTEVLSPPDVAALIMELQSVGLRVEAHRRGRQAAPARRRGDAVDRGRAGHRPDHRGSSRTRPTRCAARTTAEGIYRDGSGSPARRRRRGPRFYDLTTADGVPYWQIALMHLDSLASTVLQTCAYWGNDDQCTFCGIGVSLAAGAPSPRRPRRMLAEVAVAARDLDGAVDATLTTGSTATPDRGALYVGRCGEAVKEAAGLPVEVQFEPPSDLDVIDRSPTWASTRSASTSSPSTRTVLARVAPGKARTGIEAYFTAWERAVALFGEGQVSTYVILGMGEDPELTVDGCRRAIDMGVYPFVVPLRPVAGQPDAGRARRRPRAYTERDLPEGGRVPGRPRAGRRHRGGRLRSLPGLLVAQPGAAVGRRQTTAADRAASGMSVTLPESVAVVNVGLPLFADAVRDQGRPVEQVDWRIPAGGDPELVARARAGSTGRRAARDRRGQRRGAAPAGPGRAAAGRRSAPAGDGRARARAAACCCTAGPAIELRATCCDPLRRSMRAAVVAEGWAADVDEADAAAAPRRGAR